MIVSGLTAMDSDAERSECCPSSIPSKGPYLQSNVQWKLRCSKSEIVWMDPHLDVSLAKDLLKYSNFSNNHTFVGKKSPNAE